MKKWPCDECLVKPCCNKECNNFLEATDHCIDITVFGSNRRQFLYYGSMVDGPMINIRDILSKLWNKI